MPTITEAGDYTATVSKAEFGESKNGTPFLALNFKVADDTIIGWLYLSDAALPHSVKALKDAFNFNGDFESAVSQVEGKPCRIVVEIDSYEGKEKAKVKFINNIDGGYKAKPIANAQSFLKSLTAKAARIPAASPAAPSAAPTRAPAAKPAPKAPAKPAKTEDEDAPF